MLNKLMTLLLLVSVAGLTACTNTNQPTGRSQVRQAPDDAAMNQPGQYDANQPMGTRAGSANQSTRTGSVTSGGEVDSTTATGTPTDAGAGARGTP